ncbi:MAG: TIM barrel protein [Gammaproteobacteria bacterium]|nr:TIM barrel protein [Gammaproteobacteria bacterium]
MRISANLGFLWTEYSLPDAIRKAKRAGFDAVECHWPYATEVQDVKQALEETGLGMLGINTIRGDLDKRENGLSALIGRELEAREAIDQAIHYAIEIDTPNIHVMAGLANGKTAHRTFLENLEYACAQAAVHGITIVIEPLNHFDAPNYFLQTTAQAKDIITEVNVSNLKLMFDCYHVQIMEGDISRRLESLLPIIGHIQIASVPDRAEPDRGELNYQHILNTLGGLGYEAPIGIEYRPTGTTDDDLDWMRNLFNR